MFFNKGPKNIDLDILELSKMLDQDEENPTYKREYLLDKELDYSIESSKIIMEYLDKIKIDSEFEENSQRVYLRTGAYIGEIIRNYAKCKYHWYDYDSACKISPSLDSIGKMLGTSAVLYCKEINETVFPIGKVMKYVVNGAEGNLQFFIKVIING